MENMVARLFKRACARVLESGELRKDYPHKRRVKRIRKALEDWQDTWGSIETAPLIPLVITMAQDGMVFAAVLYQMIGLWEEDQLVSDSDGETR